MTEHQILIPTLINIRRKAWECVQGQRHVAIKAMKKDGQVEALVVMSGTEVDDFLFYLVDQPLKAWVAEFDTLDEALEYVKPKP